MNVKSLIGLALPQRDRTIYLLSRVPIKIYIYKPHFGCVLGFKSLTSYLVMLLKGAWLIEVLRMQIVHTSIAKVKNMHDHRLPKQAWEQNPLMLYSCWVLTL